MEEVKKKGGVEIFKEEQHLRIIVPSYSTMIVVYQEDVKHFIEYLKYIYNRCNEDKTFYRNRSTIKYGKDTICFGNSFCVKYPKFGNFLEINKIPIIFDLLNCNMDGSTSIISIIRKIKKIRGGNKCG